VSEQSLKAQYQRFNIERIKIIQSENRLL